MITAVIAGKLTTTMDIVQAQSEAEPPVQFGTIETLAIERLVAGDPAVALDHARGLATALTGADRDAVRLRMLSKVVAGERALMALLERSLVERLARNDARGVHLVNEALRASVTRLDKLTTAHRAESLGGRRPVVVVGHADHVEVRGGD